MRPVLAERDRMCGKSLRDFQVGRGEPVEAILIMTAHEITESKRNRQARNPRLPKTVVTDLRSCAVSFSLARSFCA